MQRVIFALNSVNNGKNSTETIQSTFDALKDKDTSAIFLIGDGLQTWNLLINNPHLTNGELKILANKQGDIWWKEHKHLFIEALAEAKAGNKKLTENKDTYYGTYAEFKAEAKKKIKQEIKEEFENLSATEGIAKFNALAQEYGLKAEVYRWEDFIDGKKEKIEQLKNSLEAKDFKKEAYIEAAEKYAQRNLDKFLEDRKEVSNEDFAGLYNRFCNVFLRLNIFYQRQVNTIKNDSSFEKMLNEFYAGLFVEQSTIDNSNAKKLSFIKAFFLAVNKKNRNIFNQNHFNQHVETYAKNLFLACRPGVAGNMFCEKYNIQAETLEIDQISHERIRVRKGQVYGALRNSETINIKLVQCNGYYFPIFNENYSIPGKKEYDEENTIYDDVNNLLKIVVDLISNNQVDNDKYFIEIEEIFAEYFKAIGSDYKALAIAAIKKVFHTSSEGFLTEESPPLVLALQEIFKNNEKEKVVVVNYQGAFLPTVKEAADLLLPTASIHYINPEKSKIPSAIDVDAMFAKALRLTQEKFGKNNSLVLEYALSEVIWKFYSNQNDANLLAILGKIKTGITARLEELELKEKGSRPLLPRTASSTVEINGVNLNTGPTLTRRKTITNLFSFMNSIKAAEAPVKTSNFGKLTKSKSSLSKSDENLNKKRCPTKQFFLENFIHDEKNLQQEKELEKNLTKVINELKKIIGHLGAIRKGMPDKTIWEQFIDLMLTGIKKYYVDYKGYLEDFNAFIEKSMEYIESSFLEDIKQKQYETPRIK